ncbi:putative transcription factor bHLH family [Dioscorea sansibarensis]
MLASLIQDHPIATKDTNGKHRSKKQKTSHASTTIESPTRRSQKLGDRITALQQLVSPFGKTDTASVLQEANVCIKVLHEQIKVLTSPYFTKGFKEEKDKDLQSGGLCLVPISKITNLCDHSSLT